MSNQQDALAPQELVPSEEIYNASSSMYQLTVRGLRKILDGLDPNTMVTTGYKGCYRNLESMSLEAPPSKIPGRLPHNLLVLKLQSPVPEPQMRSYDE